ncbi:MAG: rhomboid family intramembrane serine protease [Bdellovibrionaceae bacterium]|nr:rhomboid family intramembrane serine protease [Pseudobdellovibrionaceae bacterium]MBX3034244.1 rhomboid family intramembrane serine protease [Pseudobdellovibrionaceae bacterium]
MILACPESPQSWHKRPVTWCLVAANVFIFMLFFSGLPDSSASQLLRDENLRVAGEIYLRYEKNLPPAQRLRQPAWLDEMKSGDSRQMEMLGSMAVRDRRFLDFVENSPPLGDEIAFASLREKIHQFRDNLSSQPLHRFGLNSERTKSFAWVTYQFSHIGWMHLISNMAFLLFLGWVIEGIWGGGVLLLLYLTGGFAGGLLFLSLSPAGIIPMVGASGSVSALISFYSLAETRRRVRYYFMLLPWQNLHGFVYLPTLLIWPLYLVSDFAGLIAAPEGFITGVAYSAHVGGALLGATLALNFRLFRQPT